MSKSQSSSGLKWLKSGSFIHHAVCFLCTFSLSILEFDLENLIFTISNLRQEIVKNFQIPAEKPAKLGFKMAVIKFIIHHSVGCLWPLSLSIPKFDSRNLIFTISNSRQKIVKILRNSAQKSTEFGFKMAEIKIYHTPF